MIVGEGTSVPSLHILTKVDTGARTAHCIICGHTKIRLRSDNKRWRCTTSEKAARYGLKAGEFNELIESQNNRCAICNRKMWSPHIDHNHSTGAVRGLLCSNCNTGIGLLGDSPERLLSAILYLDPEWKDET